MIDLITRIDKWIKTDINAVQEIINRYATVLEHTVPQKNIPYLAIIIDNCVQYLNGSHGELKADWKAWSVLLIKKLFDDGKLKQESDIPKIIDEFVEFKDKLYQKYCDNTISATEYDRDRGFIYNFYFKKKTNDKIH